MASIDDFDKAENKINELLNLRDRLNDAAPLFNDLKDNLQWYKKVCTEIPEQSNAILSFLDDPLKETIALTPDTLSMNIVTGTTGSFHAYSGETRSIIQSYGPKHYHLITEYRELNKTDDLTEKIITIIESFRPELRKFHPVEVLNEAKDAFELWKAGALDNSELASHIRAFQDIFNGALHMGRVAISKKEKLDESWPKLAEDLAKSTSATKSIKNLQNKEQAIHDAFTTILKKTNIVSKEEMSRNYTDYIEHAYSLLLLIDINKLK